MAEGSPPDVFDSATAWRWRRLRATRASSLAVSRTLSARDEFALARGGLVDRRRPCFTSLGRCPTGGVSLPARSEAPSGLASLVIIRCASGYDKGHPVITYLYIVLILDRPAMMAKRMAGERNRVDRAGLRRRSASEPVEVIADGGVKAARLFTAWSRLSGRLTFQSVILPPAPCDNVLHPSSGNGRMRDASGCHVV